MSQYWDTIRLFNILLAIVILAMMIVRFKEYEVQTRQIRLFGTGLLMLLMSQIYGTIELYLRGVPGGPRVIVITIPLLTLTVACVWPQLVTVHEWWKSRRRVEDREDLTGRG